MLKPTNNNEPEGQRGMATRPFLQGLEMVIHWDCAKTRNRRIYIVNTIVSDNKQQGGTVTA